MFLVKGSGDVYLQVQGIALFVLESNGMVQVIRF